MPVTLRKSKTKKGYSLYFDISYKGKRWTEWPQIHIKAENGKAENDEKIALAKKMKVERERELTVLGKGLPGEVKLRERDFFDVYDEMCAVRTKSKHIYENIRKKIAKHNGKQPLPILAIDKPWLMGFLAFLKREKLAHNTVHQYFSHVGTILKEAMCVGYIVQNPFNLIARNERPKLKRGKADHLTVEELNKFIHAETTGADDQLKKMFLFSCFTGLRWSDCQRVMWKHIRTLVIDEKPQEVIILTQKKTSEQVVVPLTPSALAVLEERKREMLEGEHKSKYIFSRWSEEAEEKAKKPLRRAMSVQMRSWAKQVEFDRQFRFHLARHTYATWLIQNGVDLYTVSKLLGHADMSATTIYAHVSDHVKIQAAARLPFVDIHKKPEPTKRHQQQLKKVA